MTFNSAPAKQHLTQTLAASAAAAKAACEAIGTGFRYKAIWFNTAGTASVVDSYGHAETITVAAGSIYPCDNCGVKTGGSLVAADIVLLYD